MQQVAHQMLKLTSAACFSIVHQLTAWKIVCYVNNITLSMKMPPLTAFSFWLFVQGGIVVVVVDGQSTTDNLGPSIFADLLLQVEENVRNDLERMVTDVVDRRLSQISCARVRLTPEEGVGFEQLEQKPHVDILGNDPTTAQTTNYEYDYHLGEFGNLTQQQQLQTEPDLENATHGTTSRSDGVGEDLMTTSASLPVELDQLSTVDVTSHRDDHAAGRGRVTQDQVDALEQQLVNISDALMMLNQSWEARFADELDGLKMLFERVQLSVMQHQAEQTAKMALEQNRTRTSFEEFKDEFSRITHQLQTSIGGFTVELNEVKDNYHRMSNNTMELQVSVQEISQKTSLLVPGKDP